MRKHPIQNTNIDKNGTLRFVENKIVSFLLDQYKPNLNGLIVDTLNGKFAPEDYEQLMMLIGYSLDGFGDLCSSDRAFRNQKKCCHFKTLAAADRKKLYKPKEN